MQDVIVLSELASASKSREDLMNQVKELEAKVEEVSEQKVALKVEVRKVGNFIPLHTHTHGYSESQR
jgi:phage shock protein A